MKLFRRKKLTPEELEEKSRREKEWADKCYRTGERLGRKYNIADKIERINRYANRYPKTFFLTLFGIILACFFINWLFVGISFHSGDDIGNEIRTVTIEPDRSRYNDALSSEINSLYKELEGYAKELEKYTLKDSLSHSDSVRIGKMILRMKELNELIEGKEGVSKAFQADSTSFGQ